MTAIGIAIFLGTTTIKTTTRAEAGGGLQEPSRRPSDQVLYNCSRII